MEKIFVKPINENYDAVVIGGGAAGLAAAIRLKMLRSDLSVAILEKNQELGRKIRATGNGRCNITNTEAPGYKEIRKFFNEIGLAARVYDNGLVYPYSESAADIVSLLGRRVSELGVKVITGANVTALEQSRELNWLVRHEQEGRRKTVTATSVILATGGKSGPGYGTTGDGFGMARNLGHTIITPIPVLTPVECREWGEEPDAAGLAGIRCRGAVSLFCDGGKIWDDENLVTEEDGEIQFTKYGLSGICVFNISRYMRYNRSEGEKMDQFLLRLDLAPDMDIYQYIEGRMDICSRDEMVQSLLTTVVKNNMADYLLKRAGVDGLKAISAMVPEDVEAIARAVHQLEFHPTGVKGWKDAQVTAGGVMLDEIDEETCQSKLHKGLYIAGEVADYDGPCGGYNLSNAWLMGLKAANAIAAAGTGMGRKWK